MGIDYEGRHVTVKICHVGIEKEYIDEVMISQEFSKYYGSFQSERLNKKILISAVDYLHPISGIQNKLRAFYNFLQDNPKRRKNVIMVQHAVPMKTLV